MTKKALLVIDMLNDFSKKEGTLFVPENEQIVPVIQSWIKDFRDSNDYIIYICDNHKKDDKEFKKMNWPPHAIEGTWGANIIDELKPNISSNREFIVKKSTYSSFYNTGLERLLKSLKVKTLYLTGCVVNICVYFAAMEAALRDYDVFVVKKGVAALREDDKNYIFKDMENVLGVKLV